MAQKVMLIDDLDGSEGAETITYSVDGQDYEIDLSEKNAEKFRSAMKEYIDVSRPVERRPVMTLASSGSSRRQSAGGSGRDDISQVRQSAKAIGYEAALWDASRRKLSTPTTGHTADPSTERLAGIRLSGASPSSRRSPGGKTSMQQTQSHMRFLAAS